MSYMDITKRKLVFVLFISIFLLTSKVYAADDSRLYSQAVKAARKGKDEIAFMKFNMILEMHLKSKLRERALFATGEYYFSVSNYYDAAMAFREFISKYPESKSRIFALAYLLKITRKLGSEDSINALEKEIATFQQLSLFFRKSKNFKYTSPFSKRYKAEYFIDRVEIYIDGEFLTKVSF